jgi:hypothetical protein
LKGEERVCHVTEADRLGAAKAVRLSEEVSSCEAVVCYGPPPPAFAGASFGGCPPLKRGEQGFAPVRGGVMALPRRNPWFGRNGSAGIKRK